jgi:hypothetical protein
MKQKLHMVQQTDLDFPTMQQGIIAKFYAQQGPSNFC